MTSEVLKFVHIRPTDYVTGQLAPHGGLTIAYQPPLRHGDKIIALALAACSKNDTYCKAEGRAIAQSKFENGEFINLPIDPSRPIGHQLKEAFYSIMRMGVPHDNEERYREQRMYKSGQKSEQRRQRRLQERQSAERQPR